MRPIFKGRSDAYFYFPRACQKARAGASVAIMLPLRTATAFRGVFLQSGRIKLVHRERHRSEKSTRVILIRCGRAFLVGDGILRRIYKVLRGALKTNDREHADGDRKTVTAVFRESLGKKSRNLKRKRIPVANTAITTAVSATVAGICATAVSCTRVAVGHNACLQNNRLHRFDHGGRISVAAIRAYGC